MQGERTGCAAHCWVYKSPASVMNTASPGAMSRISSKPSTSRATLSEAIMNSAPWSVSRRPNTTGRMPKGSRKPISP